MIGKEISEYWTVIFEPERFQDFEARKNEHVHAFWIWEKGMSR
ncbi:hypothetical protein ACJIZ3_025044 [Penstemon smallii]|uniref:Uncharacterized protein n=1 Tax=Penstemon smallii TaxID=265156 RepID=A0ABD3TWU6_9LAMI